MFLKCRYEIRFHYFITYTRTLPQGVYVCVCGGGGIKFINDMKQKKKKKLKHQNTINIFLFHHFAIQGGKALTRMCATFRDPESERSGAMFFLEPEL